MTGKASFNVRGITLHLSDGDVILNAGNNMTIFPQGDLITFSAQIPAGVVINNVNAWQPPSISDANALPNSVYFSTTAGKLVYKAADSSIFPLY